MKQENPQKSRKKVWLIVAIVALLAVIGVVLALVLPGLLQPQQGDGLLENPQVYFNLDRTQMIDPETTLSTRTPGEDGLYHIRFSVYGEVKDVSVINDKKLVNYIDTLDVMCPVFDADGVIIDVQNADQYFMVTKDLYVKRMLNGNLEANSSTAMNGMDMKFAMNEASGIYDCQLTAANPGTPSEASWLDKIIAVTDKEKTYAHIYIVDNLSFEGEVAWRAEVGMYANNATIREPDENGVYTMQFFIDGKLVERKSKNKDKVSQIDKLERFTCAIALEYDEEGYIIDWFSPSFVLRGFELCKGYTVTAVENGTFTATRNLSGTMQGDMVEATYDETCKIWMCCRGCNMDKPTCEKTTELKVGDIVTVYTDLDGKPIEIYVGLRQADSPMYYNVARKWSTAEAKSTRKPDEEGYYTIDLAVNGKVKQFKTKNFEHVNYIDGLYYYAVGLKTSGNIIKEVYAGTCVCGYTGAFVNRYVTNTVGTVVTVVLPPDLEAGKNWLTSGRCEIYDVSGDYGTTKGQKASLSVGDKVIGFIDTNSKLTHIYITQHYNKGMTVAYNVNRQYDSKTLGTARTPDADGYYVFDLALNGTVKQYKTKNKAMADFIDQQSPYMVGVKVSGNIIKDVCFARSAVPYGAAAYNNNRVDNTKGGVVSAYNFSGAERKESTSQYTLGKKTKIYNVSAVFDKQQGEKTKLKANDQITSIVNVATGELEYVFVLNRSVKSDLYWHKSRVQGTHMEDGVKVTNRTPDADGYYVFELFHNGKVITVKTKDLAIATQVDMYSQAFGLVLDGNIIKRVLPFGSTPHFQTVAGNYDITKVTKDAIYATRMRASASDYGTEAVIKYNKNTIFINTVSSSDDFGKIVTPKVGDRIVMYAGSNGVASYGFITQQNSHQKGAFSYCPHCNKTVFWDKWSSTNFADGMHCYLPSSGPTGSTYTFGTTADDKNFDMVLDLNGQTMSGNLLLVDVYDKLTIVDTVGGGKIEGGKGGNVRVNSGATLTVLSGTITGGNTTLTGVGGNIYADNATVNIKGGTISNGVSYLGSNIYHAGTKGSVNISGGKITGGSVYAENSKIINVSGNVEINNVIVKPGNIINVGKLSSNASITVKADGVFTNDGAASYIGNFKTTDAADKITAAGSALKYTNNSGVVVPTRPSVNDPLVLDENSEGLCLVCGVKVKWVPIHDGEVIGDMKTDDQFTSQPAGSSFHYYLADDNMVSGNDDFLFTHNYHSVCLHLNGKYATLQGGIYGSNATVLNIMGEGTLNHLGTATGGVSKARLFHYYTASLNLYGGTYESNKTLLALNNNAANIKISTDAVVNETINLNQSKLTLEGGAKVQKIEVSGTGKLTVDQNFTGSAVADFDAAIVENGIVKAANGAATGDFAGSVITSAGNVIKNQGGKLAITAQKVTPPVITDEELAAPPDASGAVWGVFEPWNCGGKAYCETCGQIAGVKTWTPITEALGLDAPNGHYYLADDVVCNETYFYKTSNGHNRLCLNLNGKNLTTSGMFYLGNTSQVGIMGEGNVLYTGATELFLTYSCTFKIYGGNYSVQNSSAKIQNSQSTYHTHIRNNVKIDGMLQFVKGFLHVYDNISLTDVRIGTNNNTMLRVEDGFAGKITKILFEAPLEGNLVPAKHGVVVGDFTGTITTVYGEAVTHDKATGQLKVDAVSHPPKDVFDLVNNTEAWCEACSVYIPKAEWTPLTAQLGADPAAGHYYLADGFAATGTMLSTTKASTGRNYCLHLNGKTVETAYDFKLGNGIYFNLVGNGGITYTGATQLFTVNSATLKVYGGTYKTTQDGAKVQNNAGTYHTYLYNDTYYDGLLDSVKGTVHLYDATRIKAMTVDTGALLRLESGWTGEIKGITFKADLESGNLVPADDAAVIGNTLGGTITTIYGETVVLDETTGQLKVNVIPHPPKDVFDLVNNTEAWCYDCGAYIAKEDWTPLTAQLGADPAAGHYYLADGFAATGTMLSTTNASTGRKYCVHLNGKTVETAYDFKLGNGIYFNLMGQGGITYTGATRLFTVNSATLKVYGGTYSTTQDGAKVQHNAGTYHTYLYNGAYYNGLLHSVKGTVHLYDAARVKAMTVDTDAQLKLEAGWSGEIEGIKFTAGYEAGNLVPIDDAVVVGNTLGGTITTVDSETVVLDTTTGQLKVNVIVRPDKNVFDLETYDEAWCMICQNYIAKENWTALNSQNPIAGVTNANSHFYFAESYTDTSAGRLLSAGKDSSDAATKVCLNLNGKAVTTNSFIKGELTCTTNVFDTAGTGSITYTGTGNLFDIYTATLVIKGGTYNSTTGNVMKLQRSNWQNLWGNTRINGKVVLDGGNNQSNLVVRENASISELEVAAKGKLIVAKDWAGTIDKVTFAATLVDNKVPAANASADVFTGTIKLNDGRTLTKDTASTQLVASGNVGPVVGVFEPWNHEGKAYCDACGEAAGVQTWTELTADGVALTSGSNHYYLPNGLENDTLNVGSKTAVSVKGSTSSVCLHLNGKTLTGTADKMFFAGSSGKLNIMGEGTVAYTGTGSAYDFDKSSFNVYGGTHTAANGTLITSRSTLKTHFYGDTAMNGTVKLNRTADTQQEKLQLHDSATVSSLYMDATAFLELAVGWDGSINSLTLEGLTGTTVPATKIDALGTTVEGDITLANGDTLVYDAANDCFNIIAQVGTPVFGVFEPWNHEGKAYCDACGEAAGVQTWTKLTNGFGSASAHGAAITGHYYVEESFTNTAETYFLQSTTAYKTQACINLNGKTITTAVPFECGGGGTAYLNIIGAGGGITYTGGEGALFANHSAKLALLGGTYTTTQDAPVVLKSAGTGNMFLLGNTTFVKGGILLNNTGTLNLQNSGTIPALNVTATAKVTIWEPFTGTVSSATFAALEKDELGNMLVPAANAEIKGTLKGSIIMDNGAAMTQLEARLKADITFNPTAANGYKAYCPACGATHVWSVYDPATGVTAETLSHVYLTSDVNHNSSATNATSDLTDDNWFIYVPANTAVHFNMNGCDVAADADSVKQYGIYVLGTLDLFNTGAEESLFTAESDSSHYGAVLLNNNLASFTLRENVKLYANSATAKPAVTISKGTFTMEGGTVESQISNTEAIQVRNVTAGNTSAFVMNGGAVINTTAEKNAVKVGESGSSGKVNSVILNGGTVTGVVRSAAGSVTLDLAATPVGKISIGANGKLVVNSTWTGAATAKFDAALAGDLVPAKNGEATAAFTGTLQLTDGRPLTKAASSNQLQAGTAQAG